MKTGFAWPDGMAGRFGHWRNGGIEKSLWIMRRKDFRFASSWWSKERQALSRKPKKITDGAGLKPSHYNGEPIRAGSGSLADLDRVVAGLQNNFRPARGAVFAFEVRIALIGTRGFEATSRKFRIDVAGTAIGLNVEARRRRNAQGDGSAFVVDGDVFPGRIGKA